MIDKEDEKVFETENEKYEKPLLDKKGDLKDVMAGNGPSIPKPAPF